MKRQRNFDSLKRMVRNSEVADFDRVAAWARSHPRKPAVLAFTAGPERQAAYWIEWTERQYVANKPGERICEPSAGSKYAPTDGSGGH